MINFKDRELAAPSAAIIASLLILVGILVFHFVVPDPNADAAVATNARNLQELNNEIKQARQRTQEANVEVQTQLWQGDPEDVMARVLADLTNRSAKAKLQMSAFRPEKTQPVNGLLELPFSIQVTGPYLSIVSLLDSLNRPGTKMALRSVTVATGGGVSTDVSATVALSAYCADDTPAAAPLPAVGGAPSSSSAPVAEQLPVVATGGSHG